MAENNPKASEVYEKVLAANLQRAIDFVKFAETKNAALLALSSAWVVAAINLQFSGKIPSETWTLVINLVLLLALSAAIAAMLSFLPKLDLAWFRGGKRGALQPPNLLYFGDISKQLVLTVLESDIHTRYFPKHESPRDEYLHDLIVQIGVNSQIAMRKMRFFRWGVGLILAGGVILLLPVIGMVIDGIWRLWLT